MNWMLSGSQQKSAAEVTHLANMVLVADDFCPEDLCSFDAHAELKCFDTLEKELDADCTFCNDGWLESSITISVPTHKQNSAENGADFTILGFFHQKLMAVVRTTFSDSQSKWFHFTPFK